METIIHVLEWGLRGVLNYRGLGNRAEEYAGKEEKEMKNWNKPEVEELDVRCTEGGNVPANDEQISHIQYNTPAKS